MLWLHKAGWRKPEPDGGAAALSEEPAVLKAQVKELQRRLICDASAPRRG